MLERGKAKRLTIYLNEKARWHGQPLHAAVLQHLLANGVAGGTVLRAMAGFTRKKGIVTAAILDLSGDLPIRIEVVDTPAALDRVLPELERMVEQGLITIEDVEVLKYTGEPPSR